MFNLKLHFAIMKLDSRGDIFQMKKQLRTSIEDVVFMTRNVELNETFYQLESEVQRIELTVNKGKILYHTFLHIKGGELK